MPDKNKKSFWSLYLEVLKFFALFITGLCSLFLVPFVVAVALFHFGFGLVVSVPLVILSLILVSSFWAACLEY
jgi:hypothetical protein